MQASPVEGQSRQEKEKKRRKGKLKAKKNLKIKKPKDVGRFLVHKLSNFDFCTCLSQNDVKHDASGENGKRSFCKCFFD